MPSNYVELLRYRSHSDLLQTSVNLRRVTSEGSLDQGSPCSRPGLSMLSLSKTRISVGDNVTVYWDIRGNVLCGANDWIGLFELDGPMSLSNYLDFKQRGVTVARRGAIKWAVSRDVTLGEVEKKCIFKYIHATTGCVRAVSPTLYIYNPYAELTSPYGRQRLGFSVPEETLLEFSIAGLQASGLKKNIFGKPSPYVKLSIMPSRRHRRSWKQHHGQIAKTSSQSSTINPRWNSEEFVFLGGAEDLLEVEVRNKFSGARPAFSRFLGKLSIPLVDIFECGRNRPEEFTKPLGRRTPADRVQGTITLTITIIVPCNGPSTSTQQENVPPTASSSGAQRSNPPSCALSNPSLMSSAPNILRPLTLNTNNGFLETVFPVDNNTPSPVSPFHGFMGQDLGNNNEGSNCRRQLPPRPFSELYAGEFVPLDIDLQNQEPRQNAEHSQVTNGETAVNGNETNEEESLDEIAQNLEHSVELDSADELDDVVEEADNSHGVDITGNDSGMTLDSPQDISGDSEEVENQPMEIPEDSDNVDDSGIMMPTRISESEEEMALQTRGERNSVASIELTADSPLRILEESERVREEEIALSNENLLQDTAAESDDETEEMDTSEAGCTDETDGIEVGGPDAVMEEPVANGSEFHSSTQETLNGHDSLENQAMSDVESNLVLSENSLNAAVEEDLLDPTLQEIEEPVVTQSFVDCVQGPSASETLVELEAEESERTASVDILQLQEQSTNFFPDSASISEPQESIAERLEDGGGEIPPSLLEYVDNIVGNESVRNDNSAMPVQSATASNSSLTESSGTSQNHVDSESSFEGSSVTLPMEASEPVCLDMTSLQTAAATEMLVDAPSAVAAAPTHETLEDGRGDEDVPFRPPRVKRISRSSSDPRSAPSRTHGERVRSNSREADGHSHSPGLSRPQLSRRDSVPQPRKVVVISGRASGGVGSNVTAGSMASSIRTDLIIHNDHTAIPDSSDSRTSAVESVVVAVPVSSPPQRTSSSTTPSVVVADAVPEAVALVTPILSPDLDSERRAGAANGQSTVVAVPLSPEANTSAMPGSLRSQDRSPESRDEYVVIVPVPIRQASSAPSTLQRDGIPADAAPQASRTPSQHRNRPSQENSSVIYATPLSGQGGEVTAGLSSSLPRQSTTRVTALPEGHQRRRSSSSNSSSGRVASELPSTSYRISSARPAPTYAAPVDARSAAQQSGQSRPHDNTADGGTPGLAGSSNAASLGASATLPGPSTSSTSSTPQQSKEEIQTLLRTYWYSKSSPQNPQRPPLPGQLASTTEQTSSVGRVVDPSRRRAPPYDSQGRRNSGRRQTGPQGQPVHVSIQDQQQTEQQQGSQEQQASNEETLPSNWERGVDSHGRVYYIDHVNRTTTWNRPRTDEPQSESNMNDMNTHWQSLDRRYQSFRRTLRGRSNHNSRPPIPTGSNRESQTAGEASSSISSPEGDAASPRPGTLPIPTASSAQGTSTPSTPSTPPPSSSSAASSRAANLSHLPAVKFLTRSDFIDFLKSKGVAGQYYFQSQMLKLIVSKVRSDPSQFDKYRHQVELVRFLNQFADPQMEMPAGWDKKVDGNGRLYYINHNSRTTTFIDPRLPVEESTPRRNRAETEPRRSRVPPPRPPPPTTPTRSSSLSGPSTNLTYNQQVVGFLSQSNIDDILKQKYQGYARSPTLKASVRRVQTEGERALARLSNNLDFVMLLSVLEDSIVSFVPSEAGQSAEPSSQPSSPTRDLSSTQASRGGRTRPVSYEPSMKSFMSDSTSSSSPAPYRRDFEAKVRSFHRQLYHNGYGQGPNKIKLSIRRDHILEDAFDQIMKEPARALRRNRLEIQFAGEEGLDYGGPAREFFFLLSRQLFNPYYGLFEYSANDTYTVQVSPVSLYVDNAHEWFCFCGRIIGLVIIHQHLLDAFFTRPFYKSLLRSACDLTDVEALDSLFHQSMTWVMENDITGVLDLSFTVSEEIFGQVTERELVTGGKEIEVSEDNKHDYVEQMVRWRVDRGVSEQMESIVNGFSEVLELNLISIFDARELELVISGTADIDVRDWRKNTEYRSGYHDSHKVVKWFWKAVSSFDNEQKLRLLQFVTGTSSIPYEGFAALRGSTGPRKFCIERWGEFSKLPRAHTCFNRLDLPVYRSYEELLEKLTFAVEESETFAMQ